MGIKIIGAIWRTKQGECAQFGIVVLQYRLGWCDVAYRTFWKVQLRNDLNKGWLDFGASHINTAPQHTKVAFIVQLLTSVRHINRPVSTETGLPVSVQRAI